VQADGEERRRGGGMRKRCWGWGWGKV